MPTLNKLIDVAPLGKASQSSLSQWSLPSGAQALVEGHDRDFTLHTDIEDRPWWTLDLLRPMPLQRIVIANRSNRHFRAKASRLVVETSLDGQAWEMIHAGISHFGDDISDPPMQLELDGQLMARYVRLSLPERQYLHLRSVKVFVSWDVQRLADLWREHDFRLADPRYGDYRIVQVGNAGSRTDRIIGLKVRRFGRMGNNFIQTVNAIFLARRMGLSYVHAPKFGLEGTSKIVTDGTITLIPADEDPPAGLYLEGPFYFRTTFGSDVFKDFSNTDIYAEAQRFIVPAVGLPPTRHDLDPERARELAVHVRSGDIFSEKPHPQYVQPPLSFYTAIVDGLLKEDLIDKVCIVAEDRANPCIDALENYLNGNGIPVRMQSGSLLEDVTYLRGARHSVFGLGSFGYGICLLSGPVETLHVFDASAFSGRSDYADLPSYDGLPNVRKLTAVVTKKGGYISPTGWKNTPEQRQLMLDYPAEDLVWVKSV